MSDYKTLIIFMEEGKVTARVGDLSPEALGYFQQVDKYFGLNNLLQEGLKVIEGVEIDCKNAALQIAMKGLRRGKDLDTVLDSLANLIGIYEVEDEPLNPFSGGFGSWGEDVNSDNILLLDATITTGIFNN